MAVHVLHKTPVPRPYTLFVALGHRVVAGTAADRAMAVLAADVSLCRLYDLPATVPTVHNCTVSAVRNKVGALDLTRWPITCPAHIVVITPTPPPVPF
jgi:hypothetical protein